MERATKTRFPVDCHDTGETFSNYSEYLKGEHWRQLKERHRASKLHTSACQVCGKTERLEYHHKSYKRLGNERLSDIALLCRQCHHDLHNVIGSQPKKGKGRMDTWSGVKIMRRRNKSKNRPTK